MLNFFLPSHKQKVNHSQFEDDVLEKRYQELVVIQHIEKDHAQMEVLGHLQLLLDHLREGIQRKQNQYFFLSSRFTDVPVKSIYIFGDVGRGKSMLMDIFFENCPLEAKKRMHFHAFMLDIHEKLHQLQGLLLDDPIAIVAEQISTETLVLCLDELHVSDITDAMLLSRLFHALLDRGLVFVATSNQHPDHLYENGLQRELFLPFIDLLKSNADIIQLVAKEDYRLSYFRSMCYAFYIGEKAEGQAFLQARFEELINAGSVEEKKLLIKGREVLFMQVHGDILYSSFDELCCRMLGPADFLEIAMEFNTVLIANIPQFSAEIRDQARRFVTMIDSFYDYKVKIIAAFAVPINNLFVEDKDFDSQRIVSRLNEMQSVDYFELAHLSR